MKVFAIGATVIAGAAGGIAWHARTDGARKLAEQRAAVEQCQHELAACGGDREATAKAANEASASLNASRAELEELRAEHAEAEKRLAAFKQLTEKFQKMIDSGKLQIVLRHGRMVVKLPAGVLFASGSAELSKEGKDALREVAGILRHVPDRRFMVAGHTDNMPIDPRAVPPSPFKNNLELSTARALTVAQQLISSGMSPARLVAAGYGEHEPVRANSNEAGRQENRRIEIVLLPNVTELPGLPSGADAGATNADALDAGSARTTDGAADAGSR
ncbi:MAG: Flagellar motor rotation protein MotB [Labilithrix sp.]|nr:Flagellar motor rotation protein MotB [Labilithrix sp.]